MWILYPMSSALSALILKEGINLKMFIACLLITVGTILMVA